MIVLENVCSALTSHVGRDFAAIGAALSSGWYRFDGLVIDAPRLVSQSHPRLFIVAVHASLPGRITDDPAFDRDDVTETDSSQTIYGPIEAFQSPRRPMLRLGSQAL